MSKKGFWDLERLSKKRLVKLGSIIQWTTLVLGGGLCIVETASGKSSPYSSIYILISYFISMIITREPMDAYIKQLEEDK